MNKRKWHKIAGWNKKTLDLTSLIERYKTDKQAVRKFAKENNVDIVTVYNHLKRIGFCIRQRGDASSGTQAREKNPNWKGGVSHDGAGYVTVNIGNGKQARQHRLIAEQMLGRPLNNGEVIHHKNGNRSDNRVENIEVLSQSEHMKKHITKEEASRRGRLGALKRWAALETVKEGSDGKKIPNRSNGRQFSRDNT